MNVRTRMDESMREADSSAGAESTLEIAGEWLLRLESDDLDQREVAAWLEWYSADQEHRIAFDELQAQYERLRAAPDEQRRRLADAIARQPAAHAPKKTAPRWRSWSLAIAATVLISVCVAWFASTQRNAISAPDALYTAVYSTPRAGQEEVKLPDGSVVRLGALSSVSLSYTPAARYLVLEGEASFQVAHDVARPFVVQAGALTVKAVGTAFNIRRARDRTVVTVSEGIIDVAEQSASSALPALLPRSVAGSRVVRVSAGEQIKLDAPNASLDVSPGDPGAAVAWQVGRLEFINEPLDAVIASVNRYYSREIILADNVAAIRYTGTVLPDRIDEWLSALQTAFPLRMETFGGKTLIGSARAVASVPASREESVEK